MNLSKLFALVSVAAFTEVSFAAMSFAPYEAIVASSGNIVLGEWNSSIGKGQAYADENNIPMLVFGGSATCGHCHSLQTACNTENFKTWAEEKKIVMVYGTSNDIKAFCRDADASLTALPLISIYWNKTDGDLIWKSFTGMLGSMPSKEGDTLAEQLINSCEMYIGAWPQTAGKEYIAFTSEDEGARLEAESGTTAFVDVPLERDAFLRGYASTNRITVAYNGAAALDEKVVWEVDAVEKSVRIAIPDEAAAGDELKVTLYAADGTERNSVKIFVVEPVENTPKNPCFIGERTANTLGYGEWTMDLDIAQAKYAAEPDSHLLALVGGSLWCPDCVMTDMHLLDTDEFRAWAVSNKVICAVIDIPNNPNDSNGTPCLLTRVVSEASANYRSGRGSITNEAEYQEAHQCGAGYLSRHMVSDEAATAVYGRNLSLVSRNWTEGGWNNPDRANQNRPGVPVFYTLTREGALAGCLDAFASVAPKTFEEAHLARLDELLELADGDGELLDGSWQTTTLTYDGIDASGVSGTLSAVDTTDVFALASIANGAATQIITVSGNDATVTVTVSLISVSGGVTSTMATTTGALSSGVTIACTMTPSETYYVQVTGASVGTLSPSTSSSDTSVRYTISGDREEIANPYSNSWTTTKTKATLPLYSIDGDSLAGLMELQLRKNGKISVRVSNAKKRLATITGKWDADISADGTATAELEKNGISVSLRLTAEGVVSATVSGATEMASGECALATDYGDFAGEYAVALPMTNASGAYMGDAYMTLSMPSGNANRKSGKMKFKVFLPDGKKLSGNTGITGRDANFGIVPIAKTAGNNTFAAALLVRRNAGAAPSRRAVIAVEGVKALWTNSGEERECDVFGSLVDASESLLEGSGADRVAVSFDTAMVGSSEKYGRILGAVYNGNDIVVAANSMAPLEKVKRFSFRLNRETGVFQGRTALSFSGRERVSAKFSGVILPDWYSDCQCEEDGDTVVPMDFLPFGMGMCTFSDVVNRRRVKRSFPMALGW